MVKLGAMGASKGAPHKRAKGCGHESGALTAAYTMTGVGRWRAIVWCARCGALGFRDHDPPAEPRVEWRSPTRRARA